MVENLRTVNGHILSTEVSAVGSGISVFPKVEPMRLKPKTVLR